MASSRAAGLRAAHGHIQHTHDQNPLDCQIPACVPRPTLKCRRRVRVSGGRGNSGSASPSHDEPRRGKRNASSTRSVRARGRRRDAKLVGRRCGPSSNRRSTRSMHPRNTESTTQSHKSRVIDEFSRPACDRTRTVAPTRRPRSPVKRDRPRRSDAPLDPSGEARSRRPLSIVGADRGSKPKVGSYSGSQAIPIHESSQQPQFSRAACT